MLSNQLIEIRNVTEASQNAQNSVKRQTPAEIVKGSEIPDSSSDNQGTKNCTSSFGPS